MTDFELTPPDPDPRVRRGRRPNGETMRGLYGPGPDGAVCGTCAHFVRKSYAGTYFKCSLYGDTNGAATDWRFRWKACGRYEIPPASGHLGAFAATDGRRRGPGGRVPSRLVEGRRRKEG